ncbi:arrestin domain-containing protein 1-like [Sinocyclocheilus rhinocerous]|uniref:arrestin domain-containing protein 1-like n=1 Tax=Sinocyclocheilus rhinocerous TaxID=307959 RepID=UPI0007B9679F|nr:PREDICTED: arrestin domain-containing protein 1-like [Sinocyclocheilus rhinocerous]
MGKLQEFEITFTNNKVVYNPGESISGTVRIKTSQSLQFKAIKVNCVGSCGISSKLNDASWMLEEKYLSSTLSVADKGTLPAGEHSFPFQFLIPASVPTSFEGPFGKILYKIRAFIDTPRFSKDYKTQRPFYLLNVLNLNELPDVEQPSCAVTVSLKSPEAVVTLPIYIGNIAVNLTPSIPHPIAQGAPVPAMPSLSPAPVVPSAPHAEWREQIIVPPLPQSGLTGCSLIDIDAPPAEDHLEGALGAGGVDSEEIPTKSHSQQDPSGIPLSMSPSVFGQASGPLPTQSQQLAQSSDGSAPLFCLSTGATIPFFTDGNTTPVPTSCPLILPPEYSTWEYPHEPPPTYEESCSSNNSSFNSSMR